MGYHQAGFDEIVGVDIIPQPNYPFTFIQGDALEPPVRLEDFDLIHASPPCQAYSIATADHSLHPDLVAPTRQLLNGYTFVIENVMGAPIRPDVKLCGSMFNLEIRRHRLFEIEGWFVWGPPDCSRRHNWPNGPWEVNGNAGGHNQGWIVDPDRNAHLHKKYRDLAHARELMEMPWAAHNREVTEATPPAYTKFIGEQFLAMVEA